MNRLGLPQGPKLRETLSKREVVPRLFRPSSRIKSCRPRADLITMMKSRDRGRHPMRIRCRNRTLPLRKMATLDLGNRDSRGSQLPRNAKLISPRGLRVLVALERAHHLTATSTTRKEEHYPTRTVCRNLPELQDFRINTYRLIVRPRKRERTIKINAS